ncbi:hypothetical protein KBY86_10550 [Synechococcus sp. Lug-A]|uniref:hypothetical protein n=1 Tax=Synechococcus sp. Lug-A TaxID=2823740 RepID=UPI0020CC9147|nr:hypothetical protein [Synechococcus sp. Lug-A]MCP9847319.1 hypothetical protein [Synechococcus sp. Lug-A]
MIRISLFGASVTAQGKDSGYITHLRDLCSQHNIGLECFAYSACHFNDAGFFKADEVINSMANVCFFDWNTTGMGEFDSNKLHYVLASLLNKDTLPVFLIFPRTDTNLLGDREAERQVISLSKNYNLPCLDLRNLIDQSVHLRDNVHTNREGAILYAKAIFDFLFSGEIVCSPPTGLTKISDYHPYRLSNFSIDSTISPHRSLRLRTVTSGLFPEIVLRVRVGPYSPVINIYYNEALVRSINLFDQWCHFEREMYYAVLAPWQAVSDRAEVLIEVNADPPDRTITRDPGFEYNGSLFVPLIECYTADIEVQSLEYV